MFSRELSELPSPDRVAVLRAVMRGEPVSDPRLAPSVVVCAKSVMALVRRRQAPLWRWMLFAFAGLDLVIAVWKTSTGPVWQAVFFWAATVMVFGFGCNQARALVRFREKVEAAADYAADQTGLQGHEAALRPAASCLGPFRTTPGRPGAEAVIAEGLRWSRLT